MMKKFLLFLAVVFFSTAAVAQNVKPNDCSGTITTGATAQNLFPAAKTNLHGFAIFNIDASEDMWVSITGTAAATTIGSFLVPKSATSAAPFVTPLGLGVNTNPSIIATTTGHKFTCFWW